jgi:hypothetical protein
MRAVALALSALGVPVLTWAEGSGVPFPDKKAPPLPAGCNVEKVGCYSDGCMVVSNCPKQIERALGGDSAVHRFDKSCPAQAESCPEGLTSMQCFELCAFNGFAYAGLEAGRCCYCANSISTGPETKLTDDAGCAANKCFGNQSETCGGAFRVEIYSLGCGEGWGLWFLIISAVVSSAYFGGGAVYINTTKGLQGAEAVPHIHFWRNIYGLCLDGVTFCKGQLLHGSYKPIGPAAGSPEAEAAHTKAQAKLDKYLVRQPASSSSSSSSSSSLPAPTPLSCTALLCPPARWLCFHHHARLRTAVLYRRRGRKSRGASSRPRARASSSSSARHWRSVRWLERQRNFRRHLRRLIRRARRLRRSSGQLMRLMHAATRPITTHAVS